MSLIAKRVLVGVCIGVVMLGIRALTADAATYTTSCPAPAGTDPACEALAERLEVLVTAVEGLPTSDLEHDYSTVLGLIEANTAAAGSTPGEVSGVVGLDDSAVQRLDSINEGIFTLLGLVLMIYVLGFIRSVWSSRGTGANV